MQHHEVSRVMSFDGGFNEIPGITRIA